jgi:hypothetical protein
VGLDLGVLIPTFSKELVVGWHELAGRWSWKVDRVSGFSVSDICVGDGSLLGCVDGELWAAGSWCWRRFSNGGSRPGGLAW